MATPPEPPVVNNKSQGRKKTEMKLVKKKSSRMVTFSKRRTSIFRKASELSTLCNAHVAVMIFSPGGKIYSFGHPSVDAVLQKYESSLAWPNGSPSSPRLRGPEEFMRMAIYKAEKSRRLKMELERTLEAIEAEKEKSKMLDMVWERDHAKLWWNAPVEEMDLACCEEMEKRLKELKMEVDLEMMKRNKAEESLVSHAPTDLTTASNVGHLMPNQPAGVLPGSFRHGWIIDFSAQPPLNNYMAGPSNATSASHFINFGVPPPASTLAAGGPGLGHIGYSVAPSHINCNNFTF